MINEKAMIVTLTISTWSGKAFDRKVTKEVEAAHGTTNAGRFNKNLVAQDAIKEMTRLSGALRQFHYANTLAWDDNNGRLLPGSRYFDYTKGIQALVDEFERAADSFATSYPELRREAEIKLNGMFNPADYPSTDTIRGKFGVTLKFRPVQDADDFRVNVGKEAEDEIRKSIMADVKASSDKAFNDMAERMKDVVAKVAERTSDPDNKFHDSLIENVKELVNVLPDMNVFGNKDVDRITQEMRELLVNPDSLRKNDLVRAKTHTKAKQILQDYFV